ncbi:MAG: hypothetical protein ACRDP9_00945 [Kribbellaceae bacterium]
MDVAGARADATGFDPEIRALQDRGYSAVGFGNPLRDLAASNREGSAIDASSKLVDSQENVASSKPESLPENAVR